MKRTPQEKSRLEACREQTAQFATILERAVPIPLGTRLDEYSGTTLDGSMADAGVEWDLGDGYELTVKVTNRRPAKEERSLKYMILRGETCPWPKQIDPGRS